MMLQTGDRAVELPGGELSAKLSMVASGIRGTLVLADWLRPPIRADTMSTGVKRTLMPQVHGRYHCVLL